MKQKITLFVALVAMIPFFASCLNKGSIYVTDQSEVGTIFNGEFYNDNGVRLNVVSYEGCDNKWKNEKRVIFFFDLLDYTANVPNSYDIRLKQYTAMTVKDYLKKSEIEAGSAGTNPINITNAWVSGGYLNIQYEYTYITKSNLLHTYDLVLDDTKTTEGEIYFDLCHDGKGETLDNLTYEDTTIFSRMNGYAAFPINKLLPIGLSQIAININWTWHKETEEGLTRDTIQNTAQLIVYM